MALWGLSGFSTLAMELVWMREMALWAGNTVHAATLVTAVFFSFAALGNLAGSRLAGSRDRPLQIYASFEMAAGLSALAGLLLCRWLWGGHQTAPVLAAVLLAGPASCCSGVAFPCLAQAFVPSRDQRTARAAPFYGLNLLGAAAGVAVGGILLPWWGGIQNTLVVAALLQMLGGVMAFRIAPHSASSAAVGKATRGMPWAWMLLAASGLLSLAAQSLLLTWIKQVMEGSVFAVGAALMAFLGGLGLGALAAGALRRRGHGTRSLLGAFGSASAVGLLGLPFLATILSERGIVLRGGSPVALWIESSAWSALALLPVTISLGGIFPLAWELAGASGRGEGRVMGAALAVNKLASAAGAAGGLFVLLPLAGLARGTVALAAGYVLIAAVGKRRALWLAIPVLLAFGFSPAPPGITPDLRLLQSRTGAYGPVSVVEDVRTGSRQILLNSRQRLSGTEEALSSQNHQSWVPLLFCRKLERAFTLGMAAGVSAAAALEFPIGSLEAVELVPEVIGAARDHFARWNGRLFQDPRARVVCGDGRRELARSSVPYDAIIVDLLFPAEEGTAHLYSREFFALARSRLAPGGVFCVWLPCYQHTAASAGVVIRSFLDVFPRAIAVRANLDPRQPVLGLLGSDEALPVSRDHFAARLAGLSFPESSFLRSPDHAMLTLAGDLRAADPGFQGFPATTDDAPVFAFLGPRQPRPGERLFGFPYLDWIGKRFPRPDFPSCDLGAVSATRVRDCLRAGNYYHAAAASRLELPGDRRPEALRQRQVAGLLRQAQGLAPDARLGLDDLGR